LIEGRFADTIWTQENKMQMLNRIVLALAVVGTLCVSASALFGDEHWSENLAAAKEAAAKEGKDLLLNFTGSDWCQFCIQLDKNVFSTEEFLKGAKAHFVLVKLDYPKDTSNQPQQVIEQNADWQKRLGIEGFPTIVLLDSELRPYAFTGFRDETSEQYLAHLESLRATRVARDGALEKAAKAEGVERAKFLDEALESLDKQVVETYYTDVINEIVGLDPEDAAGLRSKYNEAQEKELQRTLLSDIAMISRLRSPEIAIAFIDEAIGTVKMAPATKYQVLLTKLDLFRKLGQSQKAEAMIDDMMQIEGLDAIDVQKLIVKKALLMFGDKRQTEAQALLDAKIKEMSPNQHLWLAKGEMLVSLGEHAKALDAFDAATAAATEDAEMIAEVVGAKADALVEQGNADAAIKAIDQFVDEDRWPSLLRAEALLHKALILRSTDRRRAAILAENKALEIAESPLDKSQIQRLIDQLRRKFDKATN
jgi:thioredoxin-related protein